MSREIDDRRCSRRTGEADRRVGCSNYHGETCSLHEVENSLFPSGTRNPKRNFAREGMKPGIGAFLRLHME